MINRDYDIDWYAYRMDYREQCHSFDCFWYFICGVVFGLSTAIFAATFWGFLT